MTRRMLLATSRMGEVRICFVDPKDCISSTATPVTQDHRVRTAGEGHDEEDDTRYFFCSC
jgi:hypothetical protein